MLASACNLGTDIFVGANTRVGRDGDDATYISGTIIGRDCAIGLCSCLSISMTTLACMYTTWFKVVWLDDQGRV